MAVQRLLTQGLTGLVEYVALLVSAGATNSGQIPALDANGRLDATFEPLNSYLYKKAINANSTLTAAVASGVLPVDAMISYAQANASNGSANSTVMMAATQPIPATSGGDFETLALSPWLTSLGYTSSSSPTNAGLIATLRAAALALTF